MRFKVREAPPEHWWWLKHKLSLCTTSAFTAIEALDSKGMVRGMVGYDRWSAGHGSVEMHCAVEHPAAWLALLGPGLRYPFEQAYGTGVCVVYAVVADDNEQIKGFLSRLGWQLAHRFYDGWGAGIDNLVFELRREDWYLLLKEQRIGRMLRAHDDSLKARG